MVAITSAGIGSGLDIEGIISGLMAAERIPLTQITDDRQAAKTKLSIYGIIKNSFADLQSAADKLTKLNNIYPQTATSSDDSKLTATASSTATPGNYTLNVTQLAQAKSVAANAVATQDTVVGQGSLLITLGEYDSVGNTFTANPDKTPVSINIGSGQETLAGIKQAINDADAGVQATIVNDGNGERLVLTSKETGKDLGFKIDVTDNDGNNTDATGLSMLAFDPTIAAGAGTGNNVQTLQEAKNAEFTINNLAISKRSNTVSDAVEGLTLNLKAENTGPVTLTVGLDNSTLNKTLGDFVSAYNKIRGNLKDQQEKDATLSRETTPSRLERGLRSVLTQTVEANGYRLSDIGMSFDRTGVLSLDQSKLNDALAADPAILEKLFADSAVASNANVKFLGGTSSTLSGSYQIDITSASDGTTNLVGTLTALDEFGSPIGSAISGTATGNVFTGGVGTYGAGNGEGLGFSVTANVSGNLGTITFSKGLATQLSEWIDEINDDGGMLDSRTDGLNSKISRLDDEEERFNTRLDQIEKRYRAQFTALDAMLASMQQTSAYLSQQLAALAQM